MSPAQDPRFAKEYVGGVPELLILRLLAEREMYGYEIVRGIRLRSNQQMSFGEGVVYPLLHAMQKRRWLAIRRAVVNGRARIYYRLTAQGRKQLQAKSSEWRRLAQVVQQFFDGGESHELPAG